MVRGYTSTMLISGPLLARISKNDESEPPGCRKSKVRPKYNLPA